MVEKVRGVGRNGDGEDGAAGAEPGPDEDLPPQVQEEGRDVPWRRPVDEVEDAESAFSGQRDGGVHQLILAVREVVVDRAAWSPGP